MSEIFNNNGITLRSEKAAALSFNEMDQNFSSFFYSASAVRVNTTNKLRLFYTGSDTLDNGFEADRYMEVLLPDAAETTTTVGSSINIPGSANQIMFNTLNDSGESILGASGNFVFSGNNKVGIEEDESDIIILLDNYIIYLTANTSLKLKATPL